MSEAAELIFQLSLWMPDAWRSRKLGPGQVYLEKLSDRQREILKNLKSEDMLKIRDDLVFVR